MAAKLSCYPDGASASYVFCVLYDAGSVTTKAKPWTSGVNDQKLAGLGLGLRYSRTTWSLDAVVAWRDQGGKPTSNIKYGFSDCYYIFR